MKTSILTLQAAITTGLLLAGFMAAGISTARAQSVIVSDTFMSPVNHPNTFTSINGDSPQYAVAGVGTWLANSGAQITGAYNGLSTYNSSGSAKAEINIPTPTDAITVQADFSNLGAGYDIIGLQHSAQAGGNPFTSDNFCLMFYSNYNSTGQSLINVFNGWGTLVQQITGSTTFTPTETIALTYDPVASTYDVFANGVNVSGTQSITLAQTIGSAGLVAGTTLTPGYFEVGANFVVTEAPEPASLGLAGMGGLGLLMLSWRRRQQA